MTVTLIHSPLPPKKSFEYESQQSARYSRNNLRNSYEQYFFHECLYNRTEVLKNNQVYYWRYFVNYTNITTIYNQF
jgi:hypothetical protein